MVYSLQLRLPSLGKAGQTSERQVGGATDPGSPKESDWPPANSVKTHIRTSHSDSSPNESEWILWPLKSESDTKSDSVGLLAPKGESESCLAPPVGDTGGMMTFRRHWQATLALYHGPR